MSSIYFLDICKYNLFPGYWWLQYILWIIVYAISSLYICEYYPFPFLNYLKKPYLYWIYVNTIPSLNICEYNLFPGASFKSNSHSQHWQWKGIFTPRNRGNCLVFTFLILQTFYLSTIRSPSGYFIQTNVCFFQASFFF